MAPPKMTAKRKRMYLILAAIVVLGLAATMIMGALKDNIVFFISPTDIAEKGLNPGDRFRLGGLVEVDSVREPSDLMLLFRVTDMKKSVEVEYNGIVPDLFREGQGVIAEGVLAADGRFVADTVLAKHDENYMPPEVAEMLENNGHPVDGNALEGQKE